VSNVKKQDKNGGDSIKRRRFQVLPPPVSAQCTTVSHPQLRFHLVFARAKAFSSPSPTENPQEARIDSMNAPSYFEIQADDVNRARGFYSELFGWKFKMATGLPDYWRIETEGPRGGLLKRPAKTPPPAHGTNAFVCSMEVKDFDKIAEKIVRIGGKVALPKFAVRGVCWQGYFLDTEGNTFGIFQADRKAK
jgi:predicted enzyme related to lactoylglutathione lyase